MNVGDAVTALLQSTFQASGDFTTRRIEKNKWTIQYFFLESLCDDTLLYRIVEKPLLSNRTPEELTFALLTLGAEMQADGKKLIERILDGYAIVHYMGTVYCINVKKTVNTQPEEVKIESTIMGSQKALAEDLRTNMNVIRSRYPKQELCLESFSIGCSSKTEVVMMFDSALAKPYLLDNVRAKLRAIDVDILQSAGQLELLLNNRRISLFPTMLLTERPDRIVLNLSQGKVILLVEGTPFSIILPAVFYDFMAAMDDLYQAYWVTRSLIILRYIALTLAVTLPAVYISVISFNPEVTRAQLTMSIAGSRAAVPYPSYIEVLFMLFLIEALVEASLRLPKFIGSTATTVGGLILGQAAQQAGLVSSIMIIITSAVAISNFVIPINTMSLSMRFIKYPLIVLSIFFGFIGVVAGMFLLLGYLTNMRSFDEPYLKLFIKEHRSARPGKRR